MFEASSSSGEIPSHNLLSSPSLFLVWKGRQSSSTSFTLVGHCHSPPAILLSSINISCGLSWLEGYARKLPLNCWFQRTLPHQPTDIYNTQGYHLHTLYFLPNTFISFLLPLAWSALVMVPIIFPNPPDEVLLSSSVKDQSGSILFNHSQDGIFPIYSFCTLLMKAMLKILCIDTLISSQFQPFRPSYKFS